MKFLKKLIFSLIRKNYYFFDKIYFNFFLFLKGEVQTNNTNEDFEEFFETRFLEFKNDYKEYYKTIEKEKFKNIAITSSIDLPASNDRSNFNHGIILHNLLDNFIKNNNRNFEILEIGTSRGYTSLCMSQALLDNKDSSKIISLDVIHNNKKFFQKTYLGNKKVSRLEILENISFELLKNINFIQADSYTDLKKIIFHNLRFAYIDGEHTFKYLIKELKYCNESLLKGGMIVVDDYNEKDFSDVVKCVHFFSDKYNYNLEIIKYGYDSNFAVLNKN